MDPFQLVSLDQAAGVATITLARPDKLNALTPQVFTEINRAIDQALTDGARALVLTGEGRFFCSGVDLAPDAYGYDGLPEDLGALIDATFNPLARKLAALPVPLVTALNGPAAGAGVSLALSGDIVVMAEGAYLLLAFVNIGLVPDAGATWLVARGAGRARALEMALLGERMGASEAKTAGLVARVAPEANVLSEAQALAARLASGPGLATAAIRQQVAFALDHDFAAVLEHERDNQQRLGRSKDFAEAISAFADKRKPQFTGA